MVVVSGIVKNNRLEYIYIIVTVKVTIKIITLRSLTFRLRTTHTYTHKSHIHEITHTRVECSCYEGIHGYTL